MAKLNQIIAVEKGAKSRAFEELTAVYQMLEKTPLLSGISRVYTPRDEEGEVLPAESTRVQFTAQESLARASAALKELWEVTATKDWANCNAKADVVVDGRTLLEGVPVTYLLFLEKQLIDIHTFIKKLPVLDQAETWTPDDTQTGVYVTREIQTLRTKKVPRNHVKAEATKEHPAQVEMYNEDVVVGTWATRKFSGTLPSSQVRELRVRVEKLQAAVKYAREEANGADAPQVLDADEILQFIFG
jgi:hypothetical protein